MILSNLLDSSPEGDSGDLRIDPFTSLPDELLPQILSFLPVRDAVSTSTLAIKWRYSYTCISSFDFDGYHHLLKNYRGNKQNLSNLPYIINTLLVKNSNATIPYIRNHFLCLIPSTGNTESDVLSFILAAIEKNVQHLEIRWISSCNCALTVLPWNLFTCTSLVKLILFDINFVIDKYDRIHLPNLKTLSLGSCIFTRPDTPNMLFSSCRLLEELILRECIFNQTNISISIPSLKMLEIKSNSYGLSKLVQWSLVTCTSLVTVKLFETQLAFQNLDGVGFPNLKTVCITDFVFRKEAQMFFSSCPLLEEVVLKDCRFSRQRIAISMPSLKKMKIKCLCLKNSIGIDFVLHFKTPALEYLKICNMVYGVNLDVDSKSLIQVDHHITNFSSHYSWLRKDGYIMAKFLRGMRDLKTLTLSDWSQQILTRYGYHLPFLGHLIHLNLAKFGEFSWKILISLPKYSPNLEILDFYEGVPSYTLPSLFYSGLNVKLICIRDFTGWDGEVISLKHLVDNAKLLKMIVIQESSSLCVELLMKIFKKLTGKKRDFKLGRKNIMENDEELVFWIVRLDCVKEEDEEHLEEEEVHLEEEEEHLEKEGYEEEDIEFFQDPFSSFYYPLSF